MKSEKPSVHFPRLVSVNEPASTPYYRGMPQSVLDEVVTLRFNDAAGSARIIEKHAGKLAAIVTQTQLMMQKPGG